MGQAQPAYSREVSLKGPLNVPLTLAQSGTGLLLPYAGMLVFSSSGGRSWRVESKLSLHRTRRPVGSDADFTNDTHQYGVSVQFLAMFVIGWIDEGTHRDYEQL